MRRGCARNMNAGSPGVEASTWVEEEHGSFSLGSRERRRGKEEGGRRRGELSRQADWCSGAGTPGPGASAKRSQNTCRESTGEAVADSG